jgi:UDP-N-acetyl-D-glucosamine dehydrogenase
MLLRERGGEVSHHDPHVADLPSFGLRNSELRGEIDLAVLVTAQPGVDHGALVEAAPLVLDLRGVTRPVSIRESAVEESLRRGPA